MAGKKVRNYLKARGFDAFYDLYHGLSEQIIGMGGNIVGCAELVQRFYRENPAILSDPRACANLDAYAVVSKKFIAALRQFFWPQNGEESQDINLKMRFRMSRWEPFDEAAWDSFFTQMAALLEANIQTMRDCHEKIKRYPIGETRYSNSLPDLFETIEKRLNDLSKMRNQHKVEFDVLNGYFLARMRQVGYCISGSLLAIRRSCEGNPATFPNEKFRADLDAFTALEVDCEKLVGLFKEPNVIERMLRDKELIAGRSLPLDETAWDSIWVEMSVGLGIFVNQLREHLQKLKSYPLKPSSEADQISDKLAAIERFLHDSSHILLEMTDQVPLACSSVGRT